MKKNVIVFKSRVINFICFILFLTSCNEIHREDIVDNSLFNSKMYADSAFLSIKGDLYDPEIIWGNVKIYLRAFDRMRSHLKYIDNRLQWEFENASELKISENIYDYVIHKWENKNEMLESGKYELVFSEVGDFIVKPLDDNLETRSSDIGIYDQVLWDGEHEYNMDVLYWVYWTYGGAERRAPYVNLGHVIDMERTEWNEGAMGDISVSGTGKTKGKFWGYYCCDACFWDEEDTRWCYNNEMNGWDRNYIESRDILYESIDNPMNLPLITLRNRRYFIQ